MGVRPTTKDGDPRPSRPGVKTSGPLAHLAHGGISSGLHSVRFVGCLLSCMCLNSGKMCTIIQNEHCEILTTQSPGPHLIRISSGCGGGERGVQGSSVQPHAQPVDSRDRHWTRVFSAHRPPSAYGQDSLHHMGLDGCKKMEIPEPGQFTVKIFMGYETREQ